MNPEIDYEKAYLESETKRQMHEIGEQILGVGSWTLDLVEQVLYGSKGWQLIHGYPKNELTIDELMPLAHPDDTDLINREFTDCIEKNKPYRLIHRIIRHNDGEVRTVKAYANILETNPDGSAKKLYGMTQDITDLVKAEEKLILLANYDELTKLPTRRLGLDRISHALAMAKRNKTKVGILLIDLDGFKSVNDTYGHDAGDKLLIEVAQRLSKCIREMDTVARLGGDEFIAVLPNITKNDDAINVADKFVTTLSKTFDINEELITIGASIGIAIYPDHEDSAEKLLSCADKAMYDIKNSGKNNYFLYSEKKLI